MAPTDDELERSIPESLKQRVRDMSEDEAAARYTELRAKVVAVGEPKPSETELHEYHLLRKRIVDR